MYAVPALAQAQNRPARFLGREEILLYGIGLKAEPAHQTVPKDIATIVATYLQTPTLPEGVPPFAPDAVVKATLRGPSFAAPQELTVKPNTPFNIPPLTVPGTHTLENIRLISGGEVLLRGTPEQVTIEVIERLLITQVTARPLTAAEIRERGIVFDQSNFQAYNFSAAFAIQDRTVDINFAVVLPSLQGASDVTVGNVSVPGITPPALPQLKTLIPDTLKLQTQVPNLSVVGFTLKAPALQGGNLVVPPIPGVIVIPGDIGFLNQYFSVLLMVGNVAPAGSGLDVSNIRAEIVLPPGRDTVVNTADDPLRMAQTVKGESPRVQIVVQPGPDGKLGTGDDIGTLHPGTSGNAEYLVEGRREGSHVVEMAITGTLNGLPVGPVQITGRAAGSVLVRNPKFTLTFTHPEAVAAGEKYSLDVTVTNTSDSPANFVQVALYPRNVSGATVLGEPSRSVESIAPGDSATLSFDLESRITGKVTAATLDSDDKVAGRFELKAAVGELGVPVSPDTLVLPKEAGEIPELRDAALGLLGKAYAVATAPPAALPPDVRRFSRKIVIDRAVEVAEAGLRRKLGEPLADTAAQLLMDFAGSNYARLGALVRPADLQFEQDNFNGFDELRRRSVRGDVFASAVATQLTPSLVSNGAPTFHYNLAQKWSYRPAHVSILVSSSAPLPVSLSIVDAAGRAVGGFAAANKVRKDIPFSDFLPFADASGQAIGQLALLATPAPGAYKVRLTQTGSSAPYTVSVVMPAQDGSLRQVVFNVAAGQVPVMQSASGDPVTFTFELAAGESPVSGQATSPIANQTVVDPAPSVISVVQQKEADVLRCDEDQPGTPVGRVVAVLFSEEVTPASVQDRLKAEDITGFRSQGNRIVGVALQPGRRIAFVALRDPIGPFVARQITVDTATDLRGQAMTPFTGPIEITVGPQAGVVSGRVLRADGTPVPFANVRLFYRLECGIEPTWVGIASKSADADGRYSFDYVLRAFTDKIVAIDTETNESRTVPFNIQRDGQQLNADIVFLGRGSFAGVTRSEAGTLLRDTTIRVTSLTDNSQYGATTDANGRFAIPRIPVGNIYVEAVNVAAKAKFTMSEAIPFAGATVEREITLLDVEQRQVTLKHGTVKGHVLRTNGTTPAGGVPVFVWYASGSQQGVSCPGDPVPVECAVAGGQAGSDGAFSFPDVPAGTLRVSSFDQDGLVQGEARLVLAADATVDVNVLLVGGLGVVKGRVVTPDEAPVAGATVGGGLSLVTTNSNGEFTLPDVPVGKRDIVAVSEALKMSGRVTIDLTRAGDTVNATIVLDAVGSVSGTVVKSDGITPVAGGAVYVYRPSAGGFEIVGTATTNQQGGYRIDGIRPGEYKVSSFNDGFTDGNIAAAVIKFHHQVFRADIRWRGGNGKVTGRVLDDDGVTPLKAMVSLSGDQVQVAGGRVGVAFQHVNHFKIAETDFTTGRFTLTGALVGPVTVSAAGQFSPDPIAVTTQIPAANATVDVELKLQPTSQVRGIVLRPDGVTPAGKDLIVKYKSESYRVICAADAFGEEQCDSIPQGVQNETVVTDENGRFWLPIVNAGAFTVSVEDPATGKTGQIKGSVRAGETAELSVRLLGQGELSVQVFSSDRNSTIPGARVAVRQLNHPNKQVERFADQAGTIVFAGADGFSEGEFTIEATDVRNGFAGRGTARITKDGDQISVKVYLFDAAGSVSGRVLASDGVTPVPNAEIILSNNAGPLAFGLTAIDGSYRVETVPVGAFRIESFEARTARRAAATGSVDLAGQDVPVNLTQAALGIVKGRVLDTNGLAPLKGWTVTLGQKSSSGLTLGTLQTTSAVDGGFLFPGTSRGTFSLTARKADVNGSASASGTIEREGELVDVPMLVKIQRPLTGTIAGVVLTATGQPAPDRPIEICHAGVSCEAPVQLTANSEGLFSLPDVPLGRFRVTAKSQVTNEAGSVQGELSFDGDIASVRVILDGVSTVRGVVERSGGAPAGGVRVELTGQPDPGCAGDSCVVFTDGSGNFQFVNVPAKTFTVTAIDPVNSLLKGSAGGGLNPGETKDVRVVLSPSFVLSGRVLIGTTPVPGAVAELVVATNRSIFAESNSEGVFTFAAAPPGTYQLLVSDPIGSGKASRNFTISADLPLGDIVLDVAAPFVTASSPAPATIGAPINQPITITFSEPIRPATVNAGNFVLSGPAGTITASLQTGSNDTVVTLTPIAALQRETRYTLRVKDVEDRFGKKMPAEYVATFTTLDQSAPAVVAASPEAGIGGASIYTPIRIQFSESLDTSKFIGKAIALTGPAGVVAGEVAYILGNTVVVFTPAAPLAEDAAYTVTVQRATDLAGNQQAAAFTYQFTTTDRTPPQIQALIPANGGSVIEDGIAAVAATVGTTNDVAVVDFYINDVLAFADRTAPFELSFRAAPAQYGPAGSTIKVSAIATDTSGNRGAAKATEITVTADQAPTVSILAPANGLAAHNGDRIVVRVKATDDLGVAKIGYRAETGNAGDALTRTLTPTVTSGTEDFVFFVPQNLAPGTTLNVFASAADTRAQVAQASIAITVLDATAPTVTITGATSGARVLPGQQTTIVVTAQDAGRIASVKFTASGIVTATETRQVDPAQASIVTSFTVTVPATAKAGQTLTLGASATDVAGNSASAAQVVLPVADTTPPTVTLAPASQSFNAVPGQTVDVVASAEDEIGVSKIAVKATGAATFDEAKQVSPPVGSATKTFSIPVPAGAQPGTQIQVTATATDLNNNTSGAASLTLTVVSPVQVTLPSSAIVEAGQSVDVMVQISEAAPAAGTRVDFAAVDPNVVSVPAFLVIAEGQTTATLQISALAGGTTQVRALIAGVPRAAMTVTVNGGIVTGVVRDAQLATVANALVTVTDGATTQSAVTNSDGSYRVDGVAGPQVSVRVLDPVTRLYGHATGTMARANGFTSVPVILIPAAAVHGTVTEATGSAVGAGVRVDIFAGQSTEALATTFTNDNGGYAFPLVTLGEYRLEASAVDGHRGRSTVMLDITGVDTQVDIAYLGTGTVKGTVKIGNSAVGNAEVRFSSRSIFGSAPQITGSADGNGNFTFANVPMGEFTVYGKDLATGQAGSIDGSIVTHNQIVTANVQLAAYGAIEGRVFQNGSTTPVADALVRLGSFRSTRTDELGRYRFDIVPFGSYSVEAFDAGTRGYAKGTASVSVQGATSPLDLTFIAQGSVLVTVIDAGGVPVELAFVTVKATAPNHVDTLSARTGPGGIVLIEHVTAGELSISASYGVQYGKATATLASGELLKPIAIQLSPTGSLKGVVFLPGGQTPVAGARVGIPQTNISVTTNADGEYRIDGLLLGRYDLTVSDAAGRLRARTNTSSNADDLVITSNGGIAERNFTFIGLGTVRGTILNPDQSSAQQMPVDLSWVSELGPGSANGTKTDGGGNYIFENIPVGTVTVIASKQSLALYGIRTGQVEHQDHDLRLDISLTSNATTLPAQLWDANNSFFDVQRSGAILDGGSLWSGNFTTDRGAMLLDITAGGVTKRFAGPEVPTVEDGGREIAVREENLGGLSVTRKVFVPRGGYFARYLEIFRNPTAAPITIDADITAFPTGQNIRLFRTSSGDGLFGVNGDSADRWLVTARDGDTMSSALLFEGTGAALHAGASNYEDRGNASRDWALASYGWRGLTIQPGETVALLHFAVHQLSTDAAVASMDRLAQLPPEALAGMNQEEVAAIRNFVMPDGGISLVPALPALTGKITGRALEHDQTTAVRSATIYFKSDLPYFSRRFSVSANTEGLFTFTGTLGESGQSAPIPESGFTLQGAHWPSGVLGPIVAGQFDGPGLTAVKDVTFSNTAIVAGVVRRHLPALPLQPGGSVIISGGALINGLSSSLTAEGNFAIGGVPAGDYTITAYVPHVQGSSLTIALPLHVDAGQKIDVAMTLPATGSVTGKVTSGTSSMQGVPELTVLLTQGNTIARSTKTDSGGNYTLTDIPAGPVQVVVTEPRTTIKSTATGTVVADQPTTINLALVAIAPVRVEVKLSNQQPAVGSAVKVQFSAPVQGGITTRSGTTDGNGIVTLSDVPEGAFTATASHPGNTDLSVSATGQVTSDAMVGVTLTLPTAGSVTVTVKRGTAVVNDSKVRLTQPGRADRTGTTAGQGVYTFNGVPGGAFTAIADHPENRNLTAAATGTIATEGQNVGLTITLPAIGTVSGVVKTAQDQTFADLTVVLRSAIGTNLTGTTNTRGEYSIAGVPAGQFTLTVDDSQRGLFGTATGTITTDLQSLTVNVTLATNVVTLPKTLNDSNNFIWDIQRDGNIDNGTSDAYDTGLRLRVYNQGTSSFFANVSNAVSEDGGRELALKNAGLLGLGVTRKIFVPVDGYFARFLEIFTNPTTAPITFDAAIETNLGSDTSTNLIATSSGDTTFTTDDRWLVTDDGDGSNDPAMAHVMAGVTPRAPLSEASLVSDALKYRWNSITVQPGQTVALMHFAVQQNTRARSLASAERLAQLPGEALEGLSPDEIAAIVNFNVPTDGSNPPAIRRAGSGTVTVRVAGGDGVAPVKSAAVTLQSTHPLFEASTGVSADFNGRATITNMLIGSFTAKATDPASGVVSPIANGSFGEGQLSTTIDIVFSNVGTIRGTVKRASGGAAVSTGKITTPVTGTITLGEYVLPIVQPGTRTVNGSIQILDGVSVGDPGLKMAASGVVTAGTSTTVDLVLPPLGSITGLVKLPGGAAVTNHTISIVQQGSTRTVKTTSPEGRYTFAFVPAGSYSVTASNPLNGVPFSVPAVVTADVETTAHITFPRVGAGTVTLKYPNNAPVVGGRVEVFDGGAYYRQGTTDANGQFTFTNAPVETDLGVAGYLTTFPNSEPYRDATVRLNANGDPAAVTLTMPAVATVRVTVKDAAGNPLPNFGVYSMNAFEFYDSYVGMSNAQGILDVPMPEGPFVIVGYFSGGLGSTVRVAGTVAVADHGRTIEVTLRQRTNANLSGFVYAGNGVTPLPGAYIEVYDGAEVIADTSTDGAGRYEFMAVSLPATGFTVKAYAPNSAIFGTAAGTLPNPIAPVTVNVTVPIAVLEGVVTTYDGQPVAFPNVFITQAQAAGGSQTFYPYETDGNGRYRAFLPAGIFTVRAQTNTGLFVTAPLTIADLAQGAQLDLRMPPTGTVTGVLLDRDGQPLPWHEVTIYSPSLAAGRTAQVVADGSFTATGVPVGPYSVQGCNYVGSTFMCETVSGVLPAAGQTVRTDVRLPKTGSLRVTVLDSSGAPANSIVTLRGITRRSETDSASAPTGTVVIADLPEGTHLVIATGVSVRGVTEASVIAGRTTDVQVQLGNATAFPANLTGADTFLYDIRCRGEILDGGGPGHGADAFDAAFELSVNGGQLPCLSAARLAQNGREVVIGPSRPSSGGGEGGPLSTLPIEVTRRIYSPASGGYVRYFDVVTNRSGVPQTTTIDVFGDYGPFDEEAVLAVAPSATGNTYAVMRDLNSPSFVPAIAAVFAGANAPLAPSTLSFRNADDDFAYGWTMTLAPNQSAAILHFAVQRDSGDVAGAQAQAQALASLSDPAALDGLSAADRALIVNFADLGGSGGQALSGTIQGRVVAADGTTPMAGASVYAIDVATNRVVASVIADTAGSFQFGSLFATSSGLKLLATFGAQAAHTAEALVVFAQPNDAITGVTLTIPASVLTVTVRRTATSEPVDGATVLVAGRDGSAMTYRAAALGAGRYAFVALPAGEYIVSASDMAATGAASANATIPAAGSIVALEMELSAAPVCAAPAPALAASWPGETNARSAIHHGDEGTVSAGVTFVPGKVGQAFSFDGAASEVSLPVSARLESPFTIEAWVMPRRVVITDGPAQWIAWRSTNDGAVDLALVQERYVDGSQRFAFVVHAGGTNWWAASRRPLELGRYYHLVGAYDGTAVRLYVDGELDATLTVTGSRAVSNMPLLIGNAPGAASPACDCAVDELKLYERALSGAEVQAAFASGAAGTCTDLAIVTPTVPASFVGQPYSARIRAIGGAAPVSFAITSGAAAPGVTLTSAGVLEGTPTEAGSYTFTATATDADGQTRAVTLTQACGTCLASPAGAIAFWAANGDALDRTGAHDGDVVGVGFAPGIEQSAFDFGDGDRINPRSLPLTAGGTFTIEFWANPSADRAVTSEGASGISGANGLQRYAIAPEYRSGTDAGAGVSVGRNGISVFEQGTSYLPSTLVHNAPIAGWTHVAVVYTNNRPSLYVNGALVREGVASAKNVFPSQYFGNWDNYGQYLGQLDEIGIYNRALTPAEIAAIAAAPLRARCPVR